MLKWTDADLLKLDGQFAKEGVALHARPLRAAIEIIGKADALMNILPNPETTKICDRYRELIPEVSTTWPGLGIGVAASVDQVRKVTVPVVYGQMSLHQWEMLGFESKEAWWLWCRQDIDIGASTAFAAADMHDFASGLDQIRDTVGKSEALTLWKMARSNLEDTANTLPSTFSVDSVLQPICMVVELSLKALLVWHGADPNSFKGAKGHDLKTLAASAAEVSPHRDDALVGQVVDQLPPYVASRYSPAGLTRLQVVQLAVAAQFLFASTVRRVAHADMAGEWEKGGWPAPRRPFFD